MKKILILGLLTTLLVFGASRSLAYTYYHDDKNWYDEHNKAHKFVVHNHHHGYWDTDNGAKVFINID
jgi:hypothetical protein